MLNKHTVTYSHSALFPKEEKWVEVARLLGWTASGYEIEFPGSSPDQTLHSRRRIFINIQQHFWPAQRMPGSAGTRNITYLRNQVVV